MHPRSLVLFALSALAATGCITPGGGGMEMIYPDSIVAGAPIPVRLVVSAVDVPRIRGRFRDLVLHYRLVGDSAFRTTVPLRRIGISEAREAHEFTIPPYPPSTCGAIELY